MKTMKMKVAIVAVALSLFASNPALCQESESNVQTQTIQAVLPDINVATREQIEQVPGIGPKKAQAIFDFIQEEGRVNSIEKLQDVSGIGPKTSEKIGEVYGTGN